MNRPIVIYGLGRLAQSTFALIQQEKLGEVGAFTVDGPYFSGDQYAGLPVVPFERVELSYPPDQYEMLVLIGYRRMRDRALMFSRAKEKGYRLPNLIAPSAKVYGDLTGGENNIIGDFVFIGPAAVVGDNNLIRPQAHIGHDTRVGNHTFISPGCTIGGACEIGDLSYLGIGASVATGVTLGRETLITAGSVVLTNTPPYSQQSGNPATNVGQHEETGILILG